MTRDSNCTLAKILFILAVPISVFARAEDLAPTLPGTPGSDIIVQRNVMLPMRDGVRLATDIYRPAAPGQYPVVLVRSPYGKQPGRSDTTIEYYIRHGYIYAVQDCRGKYDSEGEWWGKRDEAQDGSDTITWLGKQTWSNGKIGMTGSSYAGMVQYWVSDQQNPYLKALVPQAAPVTLGRDITDFDHLAVYGARDSMFFFSAVWMLLTDGRVNQQDLDATYDAAWDHLPRADYPKVFGREMQWWPFIMHQQFGVFEEYYLRAKNGEWSRPIANMAAWWNNYAERYRRVDVPMRNISGWYDCCAEQVTTMFQMVRKYAASPTVRSSQELILGPWTHGLGYSKYPEVDFGPQARMEPDEVSVQWFDKWLKSDLSGESHEPAVRVFVMGANRWRAAGDWPIPGTRFSQLYLHSAGDAHLNRGEGGTLSFSSPADEPPDHYIYDPAHPTTVPGYSDGEAHMGPVDMTPLENRGDVLVYSSAPLKSAVEVTGPLRAVLHVSTTAPATDLIVRLLDVHPDGKAYPLFYTYASPYRTQWSRSIEELSDGTRILKAEITLPPTSNLFQPRHRIRVEISSSSEFVSQTGTWWRHAGFRALNVEPGTDWSATHWNIAKQTIYHDRTHQSYLVLPMVSQ